MYELGTHDQVYVAVSSRMRRNEKPVSNTYIWTPAALRLIEAPAAGLMGPASRKVTVVALGDGEVVPSGLHRGRVQRR